MKLNFLNILDLKNIYLLFIIILKNIFIIDYNFFINILK